MAWWVIADHIFLATGARRYVSPQVADFIEHGNWAVQLFMIISGFVITHVILSRKDTYQTYIIQRFFRLYPLYVVAMIAAISVRGWDAAVWADPSYIADPLRAINRIASENAYPMLHAVLHVTMFHGVVPDDRLAYASSAFLPPAWSLSVEWQFYLVAPLLLRVLIKPSPLGWLLAALGIAASVVTTFGSYAWWQYLSFLPQALPYFFNRRGFSVGYSSAAIDFDSRNIVDCLIYWRFLDKYLSFVRFFIGTGNLDILSCTISI